MKYAKEFIRRGLVSAWGGPAVMAVVYIFLEKAGVVSTLTIHEAALGILSSTIMAFIAGGISFIYQVEQLPILPATIIHLAVLYFDFLLVYMINGWVPSAGIITFTVFFVGIFIALWLLIYFCAIRPSVRKLNEKLQSGQ